MSFRGRLRLFFTIIVIVPMVAVAMVLFRLTGESETGQADATIASGLRVAFSLYADSAERAQMELQRVFADDTFNAALGERNLRAATQRLRQIARADEEIVSIRFQPRGEPTARRAGSSAGVAFASAPVELAGGEALGRLAVSTTGAADFARRFERLTGLEIGMVRSGRVLSATVRGVRRVPDDGGDFEIAGTDYRGRTDRVRELVGPPIELAVFQEVSELRGSVAGTRMLIAAILLAFLVLALASSVFVVRALQGQIGQFLEAARRLGRGDFEQQVLTHGTDEFAALGREFNSMSEQLAGKIEEVERKRRELEETIRRVGEAFASGLDPQGVVELTVHTAVDACEAEAGRALPLDGAVLDGAHTGADDATLLAALAAAEREALRGGPPADGLADRRAARGQVAGVHALAVPIRARLGSHTGQQQVGLVSIARRAREFSREDRELLEYLAGQAAVSIENADLHETVQRQAVTDELTGLSNVRELHSILDREIERSRRFSSPLGLVMLDIDNFKQVNDVYGHQQGDDVLVAVGRVLRELSRDIDEPARYGGEELAVVTPQTDSAGAAQLAERMREAVERLRIARTEGDGSIQVTASFGVASIPSSASDKDSLIAAADAALYRAKRAGKNRVERASPVAAPR